MNQRHLFVLWLFSVNVAHRPVSVTAAETTDHRTGRDEGWRGESRT